MDQPEREGPRPSAEDAALWREVMRNVRPLPGRALPSHPMAPPLHDHGAPLPSRHYATVTKPKPSRRESLLERGLNGLDARRAERLRRGEIAIDARLDLHGLTQDAAHRALESFLAGSIAAGRRCVLVITGKGSARPESSPGRRFSMPEGPGVLRAALPHWIEQSPLRARIVALQPAHRRHGGDGAFYVYLRRTR